MNGLSVIVPYRYSNPREHLFKNVLACLEKQGMINYELIVAEQTTKQEQNNNWSRGIKFIPRSTRTDMVNYFQMVSESPYFNKSWLMNAAARRAKYDYLLFIDADTVFDSDYFDKIQAYVNTHDESRTKIFFCWTILIAMAGKDNPNIRHIRPENTVAMGGIWCTKKDFYINELKGMNETFQGYGGEDNDAYERASYLLNCPMCSYMMAYTLTHQYHDWEPAHPNAAKWSSNTRQHTKIIQDRMNEKGLGGFNHLTLIDMEIEEVKE